MSNFDPNQFVKDAAESITDDQRDAQIAQDNLDFIAKCKADGEDGRKLLVRSAIASTAANLYISLTGMSHGKDQPNIRALIEALSPRDASLTLVAACDALAMALVHDMKAKMLNTQREPHVQLGIAAAINGVAVEAFDLGAEVSEFVQASIDGMRKHRAAGCGYGNHRTSGGQVIFRARPKKDGSN